MKIKFEWVNDPYTYDVEGYPSKSYRVDARIVAEVEECLRDLDELEIRLDEKLDRIKVSERLNCMWGYCQYKPNEYWINLSSRLLKDRKSLRNTIMHELLHAAKGCRFEHHGGKWKHYADMVSHYFPKKYSITRCSSYDLPELEKKYTAYCPVCGREWHRNTKSSIIKYPGLYRCSGCDSPLESRQNY